MFKKLFNALFMFVLIFSSFAYASSMSSSEVIWMPGTEEIEVDTYGNEAGYKYYDDYSDMPQNIIYSKKDKNNNPDDRIKIDFKAPNLSSAKYNLNENTGTIRCDGVTYNLINKNEAGNYERVSINGRVYKLTDGLITSKETSDYYYGQKAYSVDSVGNFYAYKHKWVEDTIYNNVYGEWKETDELLFKYEIPFNTLWKNRPLSAEEMEDYLNGPGFNINVNDNLGQNGSAYVVGSTRDIEVSDSESVASGKPKPINDTLNPMNAISTTKKKRK